MRKNLFPAPTAALLFPIAAARQYDGVHAHDGIRLLLIHGQDITNPEIINHR